MPVQPPQIIGVGGNYPHTSLSCSDDDRGVDDVSSLCGAAQLSGCPCLVVVDHNHLAQGGPQQPGEPGLPRAVAPRLRYHASRDKENVSMVESPGDDCDDSPVVPFETNQGTGIEDRPFHRPRARSAALRSTGVSGPPV